MIFENTYLNKGYPKAKRLFKISIYNQVEKDKQSSTTAPGLGNANLAKQRIEVKKFKSKKIRKEKQKKAHKNRQQR